MTVFTAMDGIWAFRCITAFIFQNFLKEKYSLSSCLKPVYSVFDFGSIHKQYFPISKIRHGLWVSIFWTVLWSYFNKLYKC